jgi:hypothetical protein
MLFEKASLILPQNEKGDHAAAAVFFEALLNSLPSHVQTNAMLLQFIIYRSN